MEIWKHCLAIARLFQGEAIGIDGIGLFDEPEKFVFNEVNFGPELIVLSPRTTALPLTYWATEMLLSYLDLRIHAART